MIRFKATRLPRQPGPAAWNRLLPDPPPPRILEGGRTADIAIIGAGFAGLSAARRLVQIDPGLNVCVLEAGRFADGPAGRNSGFMIDLPHNLSSESYSGDDTTSDLQQIWLNRHAIAFSRDAAEEYGLSAETFDPSGKINAAATAGGDHHNRKFGAHLDKLKEPHRFLDAREMAELTGTEFYTSGLYTPGTVILQPATYIRGFAAGLSGAVNCFENSPVTEITEEIPGWRLSTPGGCVSAGRIILANNGHAESFGFFSRRLMHVFTYASMTEQLSSGALGGEPKWGVTPADPMGTTVRRISDASGDRILVRTRFTYDPGMEINEAAIARAGRVHDRKFAERFPMLRHVAMAYRWAGHLCLSWNGVPAHGEVAPGVFSAVCQNGLGTVKGTLAGISAAELAIGHDSGVTRAMTGQNAPRRLPPEPLAWLGANATLRWKEWRAGRG